MNAEFLMLVDKVKTVVIPEIGAVVKMGKKYTFNHFLKFNDGRLSKHLQEGGISKEDADQKVNEWVTSIKDSLTNNSSFVFEGMGVLHAEADGKYRWEQEVNKEKPNPIIEQEEPSAEQEPENVDNEILEEPSLTVVLPQYESGYLSTHFDVARAKDEIKRINNIDELTEFTKNDKRSTVISAVEKQSKKIKAQIEKENHSTEISGAIEIKEVENEDPIDNQVIAQVENESKILETIKEKETVENDTENNSNQTIEEPAKFKLDKQTVEETKAEQSEAPNIKKDTNSSDQPKDKAPAKKKRKLFLVAMLLIILGTVIIGVVKYDQFKQYFFSQVNETKEKLNDKKEELAAAIDENDQPNESIKEDVVIIEESENEELNDNNHVIEEPTAEVIENTVSVENEVQPIDNTQENTAELNTNTGPYHIIVGSFSKESNANNFLAAKLKEGYSNSAVFNGPKNKYYVEIGAYSTKKEASNVLSSYQLDAWILKF